MLEAALQTAVGAIVIIDDGGLIRTVNPATQKLFGYSESELIGQNVSLLMPEPFRSRHDGYIRHHLETGERKIIGIGRQVMGRRKSGAIFPMHLSVSAFTADGRRYFTGIVHDLSDQRGTGALREQALFEAIFNHLPDAVLVTDADEQDRSVQSCRRPRVRLCPRGDHRAGNQWFSTTLPPNTSAFERWRCVCASRRLLEPVTVRYRRKSGEAFPAETVASVLRDQDGQFIGLIKLVRDISKQVVQDEALRKSQRMEAIGQLSGGIAHDFNNLLTIITGNHELLEMELAGCRAARPARPRQQRGADGRPPDQPPSHVRAPAAPRAGRPRSQRAGAGHGGAAAAHAGRGDRARHAAGAAPVVGPGGPERGRERRAQSRHQLARRHAGRRQARDRDLQRRCSRRAMLQTRSGASPANTCAFPSPTPARA